MRTLMDVRRIQRRADLTGEHQWPVDAIHPANRLSTAGLPTSSPPAAARARWQALVPRYGHRRPRATSGPHAAELYVVPSSSSCTEPCLRPSNRPTSRPAR